MGEIIEGEKVETGQIKRKTPKNANFGELL